MHIDVLDRDGILGNAGDTLIYSEILGSVVKVYEKELHAVAKNTVEKERARATELLKYRYQELLYSYLGSVIPEELRAQPIVVESEIYLDLFLKGETIIERYFPNLRDRASQERTTLEDIAKKELNGVKKKETVVKELQKILTDSLAYLSKADNNGINKIMLAKEDPLLPALKFLSKI